MVLPLLYGLGARDFVDLQGYLLLRCQKCATSGVFAVYQAKRKVTFYSLPTVSVREQMVIECRACGQRFAVPPEMREQFGEHLMTEEEALDQLRRLGLGGFNGLAAGAGGNGRGAGPTLYQTLQVDPAADPDVIDAAFRRLALKHHPDRSTDPESPGRMRAILEAKGVLLDEGRRRSYDASIGVVRPPPPPKPSPPPPPKPSPAPTPKTPSRPPGMRPEDV